jgi:hypothetical protein
MHDDQAELEEFGKHGTWRLVGMHLSPIAVPPGAPQQGA